MSIVLAGQYDEHVIRAGGIHQRKRRNAGDVVFRRASQAHRIEVTQGAPVTLFITGPRLREWGFHCLHGWRHWRDFTAGKRGEHVGRGCE